VLTAPSPAVGDPAGPRTRSDDAAPAAPDPPRRPLRRRLRTPILASLLVHLVLVAGDRVPSVDTLSHLEVGRSWLAGDGYTRYGAPERHFPPLTPLGLGVLERLVGDEMGAIRLWNLGWASALLLVLVALTWQVSRDADATVLAAWLVPVVPGATVVALREGGGSELPAATLVLGAALATIAAFAPDRRRSDRAVASWLAMAGAILGLALLARPEALLPSAAIVAAAGWQLARRTGDRHQPGAGRWHGALRTAGLAASLVVSLVVVISPYLAHQRATTGSWSLTSKAKDASIEAWRSVAENDRLGRDEVLYAVGSDGTSLGREKRSLVALAREDPVGWAGIVGVNARTTVDALAEPTWSSGPRWTLVPAFLLLPAAASWWAIRRSHRAVVLAAVAACPLVTCLAFFAMPRYLLLAVAVSIPFAAWGCARWSRAIAGRRSPVLRAAVVLACLPSLVGAADPLLPGTATPERIEQRLAGAWIREHTPADSRIMTRSYHVQGYADREVVAMPSASYADTLAFARRHGVQYLVADEATIRHRRPHLYRLLLRSREAPAGLELVHQFEEVDQRVRIYRLTPAPPPSGLPPLPLGYAGD
jgi:hypothetical protein